MKSTGKIVVIAGLGLLLSSCDTNKAKEKQEELTIVVEADRSKISKEEKELEKKISEFKQERERLREEKDDLTASMEQLRGKDKKQAKMLREKESKIRQREKEMWSREEEFEQERKRLARCIAHLALGPRLAHSGVSS